MPARPDFWLREKKVVVVVVVAVAVAVVKKEKNSCYCYCHCLFIGQEADKPPSLGARPSDMAQKHAAS